MKKIFTLSLLALICSFGAFAQGSIVTYHPFGMGCCIGGTCAVMDSVSGGVWSSSDPSIATIDASGIVTGVSAGSCTISYTVLASSATATFYVSAAPAPISGAGSICVSGTLTLSDATVGGSWSSTGSVASVNSITGLVTGVSTGTQLIYYVVGTGCYADTTVTVGATSFGPDSIIHGSSEVCLGFTTTLSNSISGGVWTCSSVAIATVSSGTGIVTGITLGTATITYTIAGSCGSSSLTKLITVSNTTDPGIVYGPSSVYAGTGTITLADSVHGGTWSSSNTLVATVDPSTGVVTGVAAGTVTISYAVTGCSGIAYATKVVTVAPFDGISGDVIFPSFYYGSVKVWLIHYDPTAMTLTAIDSITAYCSGTSLSYSFSGIATDSFRVKAAISDSMFTSTGYIPTYHGSFYYWHDADVINHTSGTSDIHKDINMLTGTPVSGPGFISGSVLTGANRGTSLGTPVVHLHMICLTSTGTVAQMAFTDASGNYSFTSLPYGTYTVFPDSLNYFTTPLTGITLSASAPGFNTAGFQQHNLLKTITPGTLGINTPVSVATVSTFPNPASGKLNIVWNQKAEERATITIADITGREVYQSTIIMTEGTGMTVVNLSAMTNGVYIVSVKSASLNYTSKVEIQH